MTVPPYGYGSPYAGQPYRHPFPTEPEDAPVPGVSFPGSLKRFFQGYARFTGRASLSEFWWMFLWQVLFGLVIAVIGVAVLVPVVVATVAGLTAGTAGPPLSGPEATALVWSVFGHLAGFWVFVAVAGLLHLAILLPTLAIIVRRLHDANLSGHFAWLILVPSVGALIVYILCLMPSQPVGQRFDRPLVLVQQPPRANP
ncbi:MAG: DUF805 domain-containing protein [Microbacteriaceae bacterium]|nr:DUF805 domain-containing protein [Microbacteriaceae bacterium]